MLYLQSETRFGTIMKCFLSAVILSFFMTGSVRAAETS